MSLTNLIPMLNVRDIEASLAFYREALDFRVVSNAAAVQEWRWATIRSGWTELMLSQTETPPQPNTDIDPHANTAWPAIFYFYPDDVARLYAQVIARGFKPTALEVTVYGMREFSLADPDGHLLSFGQDEGA
jgi:catechol 2,3-dioxygenase-like lactoylglutathione lyase family enzyme